MCNADSFRAGLRQDPVKIHDVESRVTPVAQDYTRGPMAHKVIYQQMGEHAQELWRFYFHETVMLPLKVVVRAALRSN